MKKNRFLLLILAIVAFGPTAWAWSGNGTIDDPYLIADASDWNTLAANVNAGINYSGEYFKLMANISITTMVGDGGTNDRCFSGIFDGNGQTISLSQENATEQYIAPFRRISDATIKNLKVTGTVSSNNRFGGGIVAYAKGTSYVIDCMNSTSITCVNKSGASNGGIVGMVGASGKLTISGCVFNGVMSGTTSTDWCGILGLCNNNCTANINNCLFAPASAEVDGYTLYRNNNASTSHTNIDNCYYTKSMTHNQGKLARTITGSNAVSLAFAGNPSSNTTMGVIGYGTGIKYNNVLYAGSGDNVSLNITAPEGYAINTVSYTYEGGSETTINPVDGVYSFTMPDANVTINATLWNVYTKDITAYTSGENDGWYLIASPIGTVNPENVDNMISESDFDLYRFNQAVDLEWENWKDDEHSNYHFNLEPGRGYLYANSEDVTLTFIGTPYSDNGEVSLTYSEDNPDENLRGWNLVGNPFGVTAYIDRESFYVMNDGGSEIIAAERSYVEPMEGIFVHTDEDGVTMTFSAEEPSKGQIQKPEPEQIVLNLSRPLTLRQGSGIAVIDRAIVRMGEGQTLPKFQIRENSTKIYIPQDGKEYAIAISDMQGEMPVNFKANQSGSYTLMVSPENMEMNYLHLIDNLTGADVDLLTTSSYTFLAKTTDYESRFKLVFVANENNNENGNETFAFFSNGNWIIVNEGEATLQVVDAQGHILSSETFSDRYEKKLDVVPGVYMLRLIQGNDTKVQKMVIK